MSKKIAVVSGASKGIGLAISKKLISDNFFVVGTYVSDYSEERIKELENDNFKLFQLDSSDYLGCEIFAKEIKETYGGIHTLVNNAGIVKDNLVLRMKHEDFVDVLNVNLVGVFNLSKVFTRDLLKSKDGSIVNIASIIGEIGNVGQANYAASKAGVIGMSKSMAKEFASRNVRVNCVAPGFIKTSMTDELSVEVQNDILSNIALNTLGDVEDVANAVSFLASKEAKYITGQVLNVCGGMVI